MSAITTVIGNVVRDPEGNDKHVRFTVASNEGYGEKTFTSYYKVWAFNGNIERINKALKKGSLVSVTLKELKLDTTGKNPELSGVFLDFSFVNTGRKPSEDRPTVSEETSDSESDWPSSEEVVPEPAPRAPVRRGGPATAAQDRRTTVAPKDKNSSIPF